MADAPPFDDTLRQALAGLNSDAVRIFYAYFDDLKRRARTHLSRKARTMPGATAVAQSALLSMFCDVALHQVPLSDVDEHGCPMLWPLLLKYVERHCNKWNKYYQARKRKAPEVPLADGNVDPADYRAAEDEESDFVTACEALCARLSPEEQAVLEGRLKDETLEQLAARIGRSESTVSNRLSRIRTLLETA
jgi:hypothetical protein